MADKSFGVKKIDLLGDGTPTIESPNDLNLNANTVAISTNLSIGNRVSVSSGVVTSISGVVTYYGDGQYLTGLAASPNVVGTSLSISGISTLGVTSVTDLTAQNLDVSGIASVGAAITMYGATGIISATQFYGDGSKLTGIGAATTANIVAETLKVTGVSTLGFTTITDNFFVSGISTFYATSNTLNVNTGTTNAAINIQYGGDTKGSLTPKLDGLEINSTGDDDVVAHVNSAGGNSGDFLVKSNGSQLFKIDAGDVKSTFSSDVNVGSAITMYQATGIVSATKFYGDGSNLSGIGTQNDNINAIDGTFSGIVTASAFAGHGYLQAPYGSTVTFTVTVAGKDATHRYNGTGSGNGYLINGVQSPILTLTPGRTYRFTNDNTGSHPFKFYYKADKTTEYTTGVNFQNAYTEITVSDTTPNVLHYQCTAHAYMGNAVITNSSVVDSPYPSTLRDGLSVTGISSVGSAITMYGATGIISATKFIGDGSSLTNITADTLGDLSKLKVTGLSTFNGNVDVNADVDISGNLSIGGTLTYEDVTNVDSIGLITARDGIAVLGSGVTVTGLSTFYSDLNVGSAITMLSSSGIVSATKFFGDGSSLSGISADTIGDLSKLVVTGIATFQSNIGVAGSVTTDLLHVGYSTSLALGYNYNPSVQQVGTDSSSSTLGIFRFSADAGGPDLTFVKSRSTDPSGKGIVQNGDQLGEISFIGDDGSDFANGGAKIIATVDGTPSATADMPTKLSFHTAVDGSAFARERLTIRNTGDVGIGTIDPTGTGALTSNDKVLAVGVVTATKFYGDGSNLTGVGGGTSPGQVAFASTAGISTLTSSWNVTNDGSSHYEFTGPGNLSSADDPTIYLQRGQKYEFVLNASGHPFQIRKTDNSAYTDGVTYSGGGSSVSVGTLTFDVPFNAPTELKYVCTSHAGAMVGVIYVTDAAGQGGPTDVADFQNLKVSAASTLGSVQVSSGIITATSGIVTFYGDGQYLTGITAEGTGAIGGLTVKDEGSTVGTAGSVSTLNFVGDIVSAAANTGAAGVATVTVSVKDAQENIFLGTGSGNASDSDTCFNVGVGYSAGCSLNSGDNNILIGKESGSKCLTSGQYNTILGCRAGQCANPTCSIFMGNYAGRNINGNDNIFLGSNAGRGVGASGKDACHNVAIGNGAGTCIDEGDRNVFIGNIAGSNTQSGGCNVFLGWCAGRTNTSGTHNIAIGDGTYADGANGFGSYNILFGKHAGNNISSGSRNILLGCSAGCSITSATTNTLIGGFAGGSVTDGDDNIIIGQNAGACLTTGCYNVIFGDQAGKANVTGNDNIALGRYAGYGNTSNGSTCHNISMGLWSGRCLSTGGDHNIQFGCFANRDVTTGSYNIAIGHSVGVASSTGDCQLAIGVIDNRWITGDSSFNVTLAGIATAYASGIVSATKFCGDGSCLTGISAGFEQDAQGNLVAGTGAGAAKDADTCFNIILGCNAGPALCGGYGHSILLGCHTGKSITTGAYNFLFGKRTGCSINTGSSNILIGNSLATSLTTGCKNIFFLGGGSAGATACCNIVMGNESGYNLTGSCNIAIGAQAGCDLTGKDNILLGKVSGAEMTSGDENIAIGACAMGSGTVTGNRNIALGRSSGLVLSSGCCNVIIGSEVGNVTTGKNNVMIGDKISNFSSCYATGCGNALIGCLVAWRLTTGNYNALYGPRAGMCVTTGSKNTFMGFYAGGNDFVTGNFNTAIGNYAGAKITSGCYNLFIGHCAGNTNTTGDRNIAIGYDVELVVDGDDQLAIGCGTSRWIAGDSSFNVCLAGSTIKAMASGGVFCATEFVGGGAGLTNVPTGISTSATSTFKDLNVTGVSTFLGSVGIGTTNFNHYKLRVDAGAAKSAFQVVGSTGTLLDVVNDATSDIFSANDVSGINAFKINKDRLITMSLVGAGDSVGIGTTLPRSSSKLDVEGIVKATSFLGDGSTLTGVGFNADSAESLYAGTDAGKCAGSSNCYNVAIGYKAGCCIGKSSSQGDDNVFIGCCAGASNASGLFNTFIGNGAGKANTTGHYNVMLGREAGSSTDGGGCNVFLGVSAGGNNAAGDRNIGIGYNVCLPSTSGDDQLAIGSETNRWIAGDSSFNVTLAGIATAYATTGIVSATKFCGDGSALTGISAGFTTTGSNNLVAGYNAGCNIASGGCNNIVMGTEAGKNLTTSDSHVFIGMYAGCASDDEGLGANVYIGCNAGRNAAKNGSQIAFYNVAIGYNALVGKSGEGSGTCHSVAIGNNALKCSSTGRANTAIGECAGQSVDVGAYNFYGGYMAGSNQCSGNGNVMIGRRAGFRNRTGYGNVVLGQEAACSNSSGNCSFSTSVFIGNYTAKCVQSGSNHVYIGDSAGMKHLTGYGNVYVGKSAGCNMTSGNYNSFFGSAAACCQTSGSYNIAIGYRPRLPISDGNDQFVIGCCTCNWIVGNSNYNVGIGTTNPDPAVGVGNTAKLSVGILSAYQLYGDGSNLTNVPGFAQDSQANLYAGDGAGGASDADTCYNIAIGCRALRLNCAGDHNIAMGLEAGCSLTCGTTHILIGCQTGKSLTTCYKNTFVGHGAGMYSTTGVRNTFYGFETGKCNVSGSNNIYMGNYTARCACSGSNNIALGSDALCGSTTHSANTGSANIAIGQLSLSCTSSGSHNVSLGSCAGKSITTGSYNVIFGKEAGCKLTTALNNVLIGASAGRDLNENSSSGAGNVFIGDDAGKQLDCAGDNVIIGRSAVDSTDDIGNQNVVIGCMAARQAGTNLNCSILIGSYAGRCASGLGNIYLGIEAGMGKESTANDNAASKNIAIGCHAARCIKSGAEDNIIIGRKSAGDGGAGFTGGNNVTLGSYNLRYATTACYNIALGSFALSETTAGHCNVAIGYGALRTVAVTGDSNVALGPYAGYGVSSGSKNVFIGRCAGESNSTGSCNIALGDLALEDATTGSNNIAFGSLALGNAILTGSHNIAIGCKAGCAITSGSGNVILGRDSGPKLTTGNGNTFLGGGAGKYTDSSNYSVFVGCTAGHNAEGDHVIAVGYYAGHGGGTKTGSIFIGSHAGDEATGATCTIHIGYKAACNATSANRNIFIGDNLATTLTTGDCNILIGSQMDVASSSTSTTLEIGCGTNRWISGDSSFNVTLAGIATAYAATGIVSATKFCGDGSALTGISAGGFEPDGQENLYAGTNAGNASDADTCYNVAIGNGAGCNNASGDCNVFIGTSAGKNGTAPYKSVMIGAHAGEGQSIGGYNVFLGMSTGRCGSGGNYNFFGGYNAGKCNGSASCNTKIGYYAGQMGSGYDVITIGAEAGKCGTTHGNTIFMGHYTGKCQKSGGHNIALGERALLGSSTVNNNTGSCNIAMGHDSGRGITTGYNNIFLGADSGCNISTGCNNVILGCSAGCDGTSGSRNIFIGEKAGRSTQAGADNIAMGCDAMGAGPLNGCNNISLGCFAGRNATTGNNNINIGHCAGKGYTTQSDNINIGCLAGGSVSQSSSQCNIFIGKYAGMHADATGNAIQSAVAIGKCAGYKHEGIYSVAIGDSAGGHDDNKKSDYSVFIGFNAGRQDTGGCNVYIGKQAGSATGTTSDNTGYNNVAIGKCAGHCISNGDSNIAIGTGALGGATVTGDGHIALGQDALKSATASLCNIAIGMSALCTSTNGCCNVSIGIRAGRCLTSGDDNVFLGFYAGENVTTGSDNVYVGKSAGPLTAASSADHNVAMGLSPGHDLTTGCCNVFIGYKTAQGNTTGYANVYLGACAGPISGTDSSGYYNFATGWRAGKGITSGRNNIIFGTFAGQKITTGKYNVVFGEEAMAGNSSANMTGSNNFTVGKASSYNLTTGQANFVFGHYALNKSSTGSYNIAIGEASQQARCTGNNNISLGAYSLYGHATGASDSTGQCNIAIGACAGKTVCTGNNNTFIGYRAGCDIETGSMNIMIGCSVDGSGAGVDKEIVLGFDSSGVAKGTRTFYVQADAGVYHGGNTANWDTTSDLRIKKNVTDNNTGLDKIKEVQVRNFEYRTKDEITDFENPNAVVVNKEGLQLGVIAQEIQQVLPDTVTQQSTGVLSVNPDNLTWYLINAVKELSEKNDALEARIKKLEGS